MKGKARYFQGLSLLTLAQPLVAEAHPFHWANESIDFWSGLIHPVTSWEHVFTMLAAGLCIAQVGGRPVYFMPVVFVALMLMGGCLAVEHVEIAHAELLLNAYVLLLGLTVALGGRTSPVLGSLIVGSVAVFHGYQHAYDMLLDVDAISYATGFAVATAVLISVGMSTRWLVKGFERKFYPERLADR